MLPIIMRNLGKLYKNVTTPKWIADQAGGTIVQQLFISPLGHNVKAYFKGHLLDEDQKIGEVYQCADGHVYIEGNDGNKYALHPHTEDWHQA